MFGKKLALAMLAMLAVTAAQAQEIVTIKLGRSNAAEENLWMMLAKPELAPNLGKAYKLEWAQFRASDQAFKALESGQIHIATSSANAVIVARSKDLDMRAIASLSLESARGAHTPYLVREDGPKTIAELKGKTIGISGYRTSIDLWARVALKGAGLNPDRDVTWAVMPFPTMGEALRSGKVDAVGMPPVFADGEVKKGGMRQLFTSKTGVPFDEELIVLMADPAFLKKHPAAVKAFLSDLVEVNRYYMANLRASRQALIDAKLVGLPPDVFFGLPDYLHTPDMKVNLEALEKQQQLMIEQGFQEKKIDLKILVDNSYLPTGK